MKTYTETEFTEAVQEAVAPVKAAADQEIAQLKSELDELRNAQEAEAAQGELDAIRTQLDAAEARASEAEARVAEILAWLDTESAAAEAAAVLETLKTERRAAVAESASFSDEYIDSNIDRWAALSDEDFAALVEDWKAISASSKASVEGETGTKIPAETAMSHTRETNTTTSAASTIWGAARRGVDIRSL
jgi:hypothetical protein